MRPPTVGSRAATAGRLRVDAHTLRRTLRTPRRHSAGPADGVSGRGQRTGVEEDTMADSIVGLADRLWRGEVPIGEHHPLRPLGRLEEVADGVAFVASFANVSALKTADGLFLVDTGSQRLAGLVHEQIRAWSDDPLHTAVYSHGH